MGMQYDIGFVCGFLHAVYSGFSCRRVNISIVEQSIYAGRASVSEEVFICHALLYFESVVLPPSRCVVQGSLRQSQLQNRVLSPLNARVVSTLDLDM